MESVAILGATGSIGKSSLDVISRYPDRFTVYAVTANSSVKKLAQAAKDSGAKVAVIADKELLGALQDELKAAGSRAQALAGAKAIDEIASSPEVDIVIGAIVGAAGISSTFKAAEAGKKLLLAEDNELNREIAMELLKAHGLLIDTADNGLMAVDRFKTSAPGEYACILMDIQMPVMNGLEAAKAIRALPVKDAQTVPIVAMTANAFPEDIAATLQAGMNEHLSKPIDLEQFHSILQKWCQ